MKLKFTNIWIQIALALSAVSALIYEVVATNVLFFYFIESSYSIATVLSVFLFGLGIGSFWIYKTLPKIKNKKILFGVLQILIAVYSFFILSNLTSVIPKISTFGIFAASLAVLLIPTIFLGAIFPLASSIFKKQRRDIVGLVYSSDLFGAIFGTLIAGFLLIPLFGNKVAVFFGVGFNLLSAIVIIPKAKRAIPLVLLAIFLISSAIFPLISGNAIDTDNEYQFYSNSPYGIVEVRENVLTIDKRVQCGLSYSQNTSEREMVDYALAPIKTDKPDILNIGLGCGLTLSRILDVADTKVDVVEINPVVVYANRVFTDVLKDKRVNLIVDDGLDYLGRTEKKYDVILVDVENPSIAHSSKFYTVEVFKIIEDSLKDGGTLALWVFDGNSEYFDIIYYSLKEAFPFVYRYPEVFLASKQQLDQQEYIPSGGYVVNTIDRNTLTQAYLNRLKNEA